jgi:hypothetical protein
MFFTSAQTWSTVSKGSINSGRANFLEPPSHLGDFAKTAQKFLGSILHGKVSPLSQRTIEDCFPASIRPRNCRKRSGPLWSIDGEAIHDVGGISSSLEKRDIEVEHRSSARLLPCGSPTVKGGV